MPLVIFLTVELEFIFCIFNFDNKTLISTIYF